MSAFPETLAPEVSPSPINDPSSEVIAATPWDISQIEALTSAGGPVILILAVLSVVAMSVFLFKLWQFLWLGVNRNHRLAQAINYWHHQDTHSALEILKRARTPVARVVEHAIHLKSEHDNNDELIREDVMRVAKGQLSKARSHIRLLEVIATLSPLLGLLGTVLGMIAAFQQLQGAGSSVDPSVLSGGIWEALLTTAAGLIVAIPTVMGVNYLEQKVEHFQLIMEDAMTQVFTVSLSKTPPAEVKILKKQATRHNKITKTDTAATDTLSVS